MKLHKIIIALSIVFIFSVQTSRGYYSNNTFSRHASQEISLLRSVRGKVLW